MKRLLSTLLLLALLGGLCLTAYADDTAKTPDLSGWTDLVQIEVCNECILGLRSDGTVLRWGGEDYGLQAVDSWTGVIQILFSYAYQDGPTVFGLREDGTVLTTSAADCGAWHDVTRIVGTSSWVAGLVADGSVVVTKKGELSENGLWDGWLDVADWRNVVALEPLVGWTAINGLAGICADGTVRVTANVEYYDYLEDWQGIIALCDTLDAVYGLRQDGSLVLPPYAQELQGEVCTSPILSWSGIASLTAGYQDDLFAVRQDGRVEVSSSAFEYPFADEAGSWDHIRSLHAEYNLLIGIREDGSLAVCCSGEIPELSSWTDIEELRIGGTWEHVWVIGLRADGTALLTETESWT